MPLPMFSFIRFWMILFRRTNQPKIFLEFSGVIFLKDFRNNFDWFFLQSLAIVVHKAIPWQHIYKIFYGLPLPARNFSITHNTVTSSLWSVPRTVSILIWISRNQNYSNRLLAWHIIVIISVPSQVTLICKFSVCVCVCFSIHGFNWVFFSVFITSFTVLYLIDLEN